VQPTLPRGTDALRRFACVASGLIGLGYVTWRLVATLNPDALWFAIPLWLAEAYGLVASVLFYYTVWDTTPPSQAGDPGLHTVDVFVPSYNEPVWMVRRTLLGALNMRYPHSTYLLDDGRRAEMAELAHQLGCGYIARPDNRGAKAGNLNWAMQRTHGELVVIFDADHVPLPEFLDRVLGHFRDPRVAFVQTPQEYYNIDSFQHLGTRPGRGAWHEQSLFYRVIQVGKSTRNAAFFCGSCGVMRRSALRDVGGFATETITEDLHTSMLLHRRGWKSVYHNEVLVLGLAAQTATPYHLQRLRWGQGTMQALRREGVLRSHGLSLHQRINYLASALHYFDGLQRLLYYLAPALCVATGILPIKASPAPFVAALVAYYGTSFVAFKLSGRGYAMFMATELYHMVRFYTYIRSLLGLVVRRKLRFVVTDKAAPGRPGLRMLMPSAMVGVYVGVCLAGGTARYLLGHVGNLPAFWVNVAWCAWTAGLAMAAVRLTTHKVDFRSIPRSPAGLPVTWHAGSESGIGVLADISEAGAALVLPRLQPAPEQVEITVEWPGVTLRHTGRVRRERAVDNGVMLGLAWEEDGAPSPLELAQLAIELSARHFLLDFERPPDRLGLLRLRRGYRRSAERRAIAAPVRLGAGSRAPWGMTENVSENGALVLSPRPYEPGARLQLRGGDGSRVAVTVVRSTAVSLPPGRAWRVAVSGPGVLETLSRPLASAPPGDRTLAQEWAATLERSHSPLPG
jgi:cellulose synthase (UDP-forming)